MGTSLSKGGLDESSPYKEIKPTHKNKTAQVIFISKRWTWWIKPLQRNQAPTKKSSPHTRI